jgi:hypothetical protein
LAVALGAQPEAVLAHGRIARTLVALLAADRRGRLAAQSDLIEDGAVLAAASAAGSGQDDGRASTEGSGRRRAARTDKGPRRASPAERRAAVTAVLGVWRDVARDVAVAAHGGRRELRQHELLEELSEAGRLVDQAAITRFLGRVEAVSRAIDAYANPELALDTLLLEWPRTSAAA